MAENSNGELMRRLYEAFAKGDIETLEELISQDVIWHVPGRSQVAGQYTGLKEVFEFFGKLMELSGGTLRGDVLDVFASNERGVLLDRETARREEKELDMNVVLLVHIRNGKIIEAWDFCSDQYAWDEFWQ